MVCVLAYNMQVVAIGRIVECRDFVKRLVLGWQTR